MMINVDFTFLQSKKAGFTLVELLITVTILSLLLTIGITSYQRLIVDARDAQRQSDVKVIQSALEQYKADQNFYPLGGVTPGAALTNRVGWPATTPTPSVVRTYLQKVPQDPQVGIGTSNYSYEALPNVPNACNNDSLRCVRYCLYAQVESSNNINSTGCDDKAGFNYEAQSP